MRIVTVPVLVAIVWLTGCASSTATGGAAARKARYEAPREQVWDVVVEEIERTFPELLSKEPDRVISCWKIVERNQGALSTSQNEAWKLYRVEARLSETAPWRVEVIGVAADYKPGAPTIVPLGANDADHPYWVEPRTDRIRGEIHKRLSGLAAKETADAPPSIDPSLAMENLESSCIVGYAPMNPEKRSVPVRGRTVESATR